MHENDPDIDPVEVDTEDTTTLAGLTPLALLARLAANGSISRDERDAGEIIAKAGAIIFNNSTNPKYKRPSLDGTAHLPQRTAEGKWSLPLLRRHAIKGVYDDAMASARTDARRKAITLALVSEDRTSTWDDTSALSCGLEDLVAHFWAPTVAETKTVKGVTLPRLKVDEFDATPERLRHDNDNTVDGSQRVFKSPFRRMYDRGQLSCDHDTNEALYGAGLRYYQDWYHSGLSGIGAIDYSATGGGNTSPAHMMPRTEREAMRRESFRDATYALTKMQRAIVESVVLGERSIEEMAQSEGGRLSRVRVEVKARLIEALTILRTHYDLPPGAQIKWRRAA